jgi:hypothetical protein
LVEKALIFRGAAMSDALFEILRKVTTATISTMLLRKGIRRCWMNGPKPLGTTGSRIVGRAFTLRFVPVREDLATVESWGNPVSTRAAIEEMPEGAVAVADAMGVSGAGIFGGNRWSGARPRWRADQRVAGLERWHRGAGVSQSADVCRLAAADRLWRLRRVSRRCDRRRR